MRQLVTAVAFATIAMGAQQAIAGGMPDDDSKLRATSTATGSTAAASSNASGTVTDQNTALRSKKVLHRQAPWAPELRLVPTLADLHLSLSKMIHSLSMRQR